MKKLLVALLFLISCISIAEAGPKRRQVQLEMRAKLAKGSIKLDVAGLPFGAFTLAQARETKAGNFIGEIGFGPRNYGALLHFVANSENSDEGTWVLALRQTFVKTSEFLPLLRNTVVDQLQLSQPVLAFTVKNVVAESKSLGAETVKFYGGFAAPSLDLTKGVNLLTVATAAPNSALAKAMKMLQVPASRLNLQGILLREFNLKDLKEAKEQGKLKNALVRSLELRAILPAIKLKGMPKSFITSNAYLSVTGEPGVGIGFGMTFKQRDGTLRNFDCGLSISQDPKKITEIVVVAGTEGNWPNSFGVKGFNLNEARLLLSVDTAQRLGFGLRANMQIGTKSLLLAGKFKVHVLTGALSEGIFEGSLSSVGVNDLISLANKVGKDKGHKGKGLNLKGVPEFGLRDVYVLYAPSGGDDRLGIKTGMALKGELIAFNRKLLKVDAFVDQSTLIPTVKVKGRANSINLGIIDIQKAAIDVNVGMTTNPYFKVNGQWRAWISQKKLDVHLSRSQASFAIEDKVAGLYTAKFRASSPIKGKGNWTLAASFKNDFSKVLEQDVSKKALAWANQVKTKAEKAQSNLRAEHAKVQRLDGLILKKKAEVRAKRKRNLDNLTRAEAKVKSLDAKIKARRTVVNKRLAPLKKAANALKARRDRAQKAYNAAVAKRKKAKGPKKIAAKAVEAAKWTALKEANATYKTANGKLMKAVVKVDPELAKLNTARATALAAVKSAKFVYEKTIAAGPVELDVSVSSLIAAQKTAMGLLIAAEAAVKGYSKVLIGAAKIKAAAAQNKGKVIRLESASFRCSLSGFKRGGEFELKIKARFLKKTHNFKIRVTSRGIGKKIAFDKVWKFLKKKELD